MLRRPPRSTLFPLHDALPISQSEPPRPPRVNRRADARSDRSPPTTPCRTGRRCTGESPTWDRAVPDRKSTRLNSSHGYISYAVFCLKKKINKLKENLLQKSTL